MQSPPSPWCMPSPEHFTHDDLQATLVAALQALGCDVRVEAQVFEVSGRYSRSNGFLDVYASSLGEYGGALWEVKSSKERDVADAIRQLRGYASCYFEPSGGFAPLGDGARLALWLGFEPTANQIILARAAKVEVYVGWGDAAEMLEVATRSDPGTTPSALFAPLRRC